jgi:serine/threonine-protein kinase
MDGTRLRSLHSATAGDGVAVASPGQSLVGRVLDRRYRLDEVIGEGAMGVVYRATHTLIGRRFAIKVLRREHVESGSVAERFLQEARVASSIKHPNVVDISDFGELEEGGAYYVMDLLEGRSLANAIDEGGRMPPADAGVIALQIAAGLSAAHAMGVVHRDLKPDNVFLCHPRRGAEHPLVKLLDFGIARVGPRRITVAGSVLGTPEYLSPEMAQGFDVDLRADLYALGIIMFEMLTGTVPFYDRDMVRTIEMHVRAPRPSLVSRKPELAGLERISDVIAQLMAVDRELRPASADIAARVLAGAITYDLDRASVEAVKRATLAMGSNLMTDLLDPARAAAWPPAEPWPSAGAPVIAAARASDPGAAAGAAAPATTATPATRSSGRPGRAAVAAIGSAIVAGGLTLGIVRLMRPTDAVATTSAKASGTPSAAVAEVGTEDTTAPHEPDATAASALSGAIAPASLPETKGIPASVTSAPTDVSRATSPEPTPSSDTATRPTGVEVRPKWKKKPRTEPAPSKPPSTTTTAEDPPGPTVQRPTQPDPTPTLPEPSNSPRDLKDPFPNK